MENLNRIHDPFKFSLETFCSQFRTPMMSKHDNSIIDMRTSTQIRFVKLVDVNQTPITIVINKALFIQRFRWLSRGTFNYTYYDAFIQLK